MRPSYASAGESLFHPNADHIRQGNIGKGDIEKEGVYTKHGMLKYGWEMGARFRDILRCYDKKWKKETEPTGASSIVHTFVIPGTIVSVVKRYIVRRKRQDGTRSEIIPEAGTLYPSFPSWKQWAPYRSRAGDGSAPPRAVSSITVHHGGAAADLDDIFALSRFNT